MFLGIDVGTSCVKAVVTAASGEVLAQSSADLSVRVPSRCGPNRPRPTGWRRRTRPCSASIPRCAAACRRWALPGRCTAPPCSVRRRPLRPAILWNDGRSFAECAALEADEPRTRAITGNIAMPGFTAPKLAWVRKHEPDVFAATRTVLLPKDYVRLALTGEKASDMSDSAGTLWLDVAGRAWSGEMLAATGLDERHMPRLHEGPDVTGVLREDVARDWGMGRVPVVAGAGDNAAGALGVGVLDDGQGMLSLGTSGVIFVANAAFRPNPAQAVHAFCHALPGVWHQMSVHLSAASCIDWAARACNVPGPAEFFALAEQAGAASGGELFLPYLSGERTPHNDPHIRAAFLGLGNEHHAWPPPCSKAWPSPMPTGSTRCAAPARGSRSCA
jgi:xylulokinase